MTESLVDKYRPTHPDDVAGHNKAIRQLKKWADEWSEGDQPWLLHGDAGTGKTSTAEAIANYAGWEPVEINASSKRKQEDIERLAEEMLTGTITGNHQLFILDEVDSMNGSSLGPLSEVLKEPPNPVICTANENWKVPDTLKSKCKTKKFNLRKDSIKSHISNVAEEEGIDISNRQLGQLSTRNGIRDALNDLQEYAIHETDTDWDARETDESPFAVTRRVLLNKNYLGDMTPDDMVDFLNENVVNEFDGVESMRSYQALASADRWNDRVNRTQNYTWWRYSGAISEEVSNLRITEPYSDWVNIDYPKSRRQRKKHMNDGSKESHLYQELKQPDRPEYSFDMNYQEFRSYYLPILRSMEDEAKEKMVIAEGLSDTAIEALELDSDIEHYSVQETQEDKNTPTVAPENEGSDSPSSIFDY